MSDQNKVIPLTSHAAAQNKKLRGPVQSAYGIVTNVTSLTHLSAVAFGLKIGAEEKLFWISTEYEKEDPDYRAPLSGESLRVWFDESAAKSIDVFGERALGIVEIENRSDRSEAEAFEWFAKHQDDPSFTK